MFRELDYPDRLFAAVDACLAILKEKKKESDEMAELAASKSRLKPPIPDFAKETWKALKADGKLPGSRAATPFHLGWTAAGGPCGTWS